MRTRVLTLPFDPDLGCVDDALLQGFLNEERSRGIKSVIDGDVAQLPLAIDPARVLAVLDFAARRGAALERLKANQSPGGTITGTMYDRVAGLLMASREPTDFAREVLEELERLDGEEQARRAFAWFVGQHGERFGGMAVPQTAVKDPAGSRTVSAGETQLVKVLAEGELWVDPKFGMRFRQIPSGTFMMGSPEGEEGPDEGLPRSQPYKRCDTPATKMVESSRAEKNSLIDNPCEVTNVDAIGDHDPPGRLGRGAEWPRS